MTDVLVRFEDGTTELRGSNSPALISTSAPPWTPRDVREVRPEESYNPKAYWLDTPGPWLGRAHGLWTWRGSYVLLWRITGGRDKGKPLTGEWQSARVETVDEQIARLTRERDEAHAALGLVHKALAVTPGETALGAARRVASALDACRLDLDDAKGRLVGIRTWAVSTRHRRLLGRFNPVAVCEELDELVSRIDVGPREESAEKRLADLRAWAAGEVATWGTSCGCMGKLIARIDGKE